MKRIIVSILSVMAAFISLNVTSAYADVAVIVNPASTIPSASSSDVKALFLGKKNTLGGVSVSPAAQKEGQASRGSFNEKVLRKSDRQYKAYWSKLLFAGKGVPPKTFENDAAVKAHVAATANAIGYIDSSVVDSTVKVIFIAK